MIILGSCVAISSREQKFKHSSLHKAKYVVERKQGGRT